MKLLTTFLLLITLLITSCSEEPIGKKDQNVNIVATDVESFEVTTQSLSRLEKPPVDILYVIDNTGSTLADSFQSIKAELEQTIYHVSQEFDYHIYFAPLVPSSEDSITGYPLLLSNPNSVGDLAELNVVSVNNLNMFSPAAGNNQENGLERALAIVEYNRTNDIFRENAHTIIVMISNGDDTSTKEVINGNVVDNQQKLNELKEDYKKLTKKYAEENFVSNPLNAETLRFISLVAFSKCNFWTPGNTYRTVSKEVYDYQELNSELSSAEQANDPRDQFDLCSGEYSDIFDSINKSIRQILVGHKYDHWLISTQSESNVEESDITLTKINGKTGERTDIPRDSENGFEYLGYKEKQNTRYYPDAGEAVTGLVVKLNGDARVSFPDYIVAKTRTPTEFFGYLALPQAPELETLKVEINGTSYGQSKTDGWSYLGWRDVINTKVPGPENASVEPPLNKSGYIIQLHGGAIFSSGDQVKVSYKAEAL